MLTAVEHLSMCQLLYVGLEGGHGVLPALPAISNRTCQGDLRLVRLLMRCGFHETDRTTSDTILHCAMIQAGGRAGGRLPSGAQE